MATEAPNDVEMTAPPEAVSVGPDYSSIASSMALVREEEIDSLIQITYSTQTQCVKRR